MTAAQPGRDGGWRGGLVGPATWCVLAPNPGPMTLDGTNTWVVHDGPHAVVVDPGPLDTVHLRAVLATAEGLGANVEQVLLTHGHLDHSEGAAELSALAGGVPVRALDPRWRLGVEGLAGGDVVGVGDLELRVVATPGHSSDSLSFVLDGEPTAHAGEPSRRCLLSGDTVLGRGTSVVAHPDGRLGPYLDSLARLRDLAAPLPVRLLPGHGPVLDDAAAVLEQYLAHRVQRLEQVRAAVAAGDRDAAAVVRRVYTDVDPALWPAAERSVQAQLLHLAELPDS